MKAALVSLLTTALSLFTMAVGQGAPARPQVYYWSQLSGEATKIVALDVDQNFSVTFTLPASIRLAALIDWALSPDGQHFVIINDYDLMLIDNRGGEQQWLTQNDANNHSPVWSPDGTRIAFLAQPDHNSELYVMDADGSHQQRLTVNDNFDSSPVWSPDGTRIAFVSRGKRSSQIFVVDADGNNLQQLSLDAAYDEWPSWSPDGRQIAYASFRDGDTEIYVMDADGKNPHPLTANESDDLAPVWSPDGQKIIFRSDRGDSRRHAIYSMNADGTDQRLVAATEGIDSSPLLSPDGQFIIFYDVVSSAGRSFVADVDGTRLRLLMILNSPMRTLLWFTP